ncbi:GNAT family N-acetyltransferase [Nannocystaceae bacterium ST9]
MHEGDLERKVAWANDPEVDRWIAFGERITLEGTQKWFAAQRRDPSVILQTICWGDEPIGYVKLAREGAHRGVYHGLAIGEPSYWGRGLGKAAVREVLTIAFERERWTRLWGYWPAWNERSIGLHEALGFRREGLAGFRRRDLDGREHEVWILAATPLVVGS